MAGGAYKVTRNAHGFSTKDTVRLALTNKPANGDPTVDYFVRKVDANTFTLHTPTTAIKAVTAVVTATNTWTLTAHGFATTGACTEVRVSGSLGTTTPVLSTDTKYYAYGADVNSFKLYTVQGNPPTNEVDITTAPTGTLYVTTQTSIVRWGIRPPPSRLRR